MSKREMKYPAEKRLSHKLSSILRHGNDGFKEILIKNEGWLDIDYLLKNSNYCVKNKVTRELLNTVVETNEKQRFKIENNKIRANQGHSIPVGTSDLKTIDLDQAKTYDFIVHGTYYKSIGVILKTGLNRMNREHIHLTASDRVDKSIGVISGFRNSCDVLIYIDIVTAVQDGIKFYVSDNNVVLCEGPLPVKYFLKAMDRDSGSDLLKRGNVEKNHASCNSSSSNNNETDKNSKKTMENRAKNLKKKIIKIQKLKAEKPTGIKISADQEEMIKKLSDFEKELTELNTKLANL